ncbi:MAG: hypothetical protein H0W83_03795 [Planctomycetes bacterium]|nr:hypothetical protein [Planctomycetota bacterium]
MRIFLLILLILLAGAVCRASDLPDDVKTSISLSDDKQHEIAAKAAADVAKERAALIQNLTKIVEREDKAKHDAAAAEVKKYLQTLGVDASKPAPTAKVNPPWADFIKTVGASSQGTKPGVGVIQIAGKGMKTAKGLNVVAMADGGIVLEKSYCTQTDFLNFIGDIDQLPAGAYVVMVLKEGVDKEISSKARKCFKDCGGRRGALELEAECGYILIGAKGMGAGAGHEQVSKPKEMISFPPPSEAGKK